MFTVMVDSVEDIKERLQDLNEYQTDCFNKAVQILNEGKNKASLEELQSAVLFLMSLANTFFVDIPRRSEISNELKEISINAIKLSKSLKNAHPKTKYILSRKLVLGNSKDITYESYIQNQIKILNDIANGAKESANNHIIEFSKTGYLSPNLSNQDEFVGFCMAIYKKYIGKQVTKTENGPFDDFARSVFNATANETDYRTASFIGSVNKILDSNNITKS